MTLLIKDTMEVTTTDFVVFSPSIFLANIGGSLGLWLHCALKEVLTHVGLFHTFFG